DVPPLTVQLLAMPDSTTVWLPVLTPVKVMVWLMPIAWPAPPRSEERRAGGAGGPPEVLVVTARVPVGGGGVWQLTEKDAVAVPPAVIVSVREVPPLTVQLLAIPDKTTV